MWTRFLILIFLFSRASSALASQWVLYTNDEQALNYNQIMTLIQPGDEIILNEKKFQVEGILGSRWTTKVFDIGSGRALRVPLAKGNFRDSDYKEFIDAFFRGQQILKDAGIRVVQIDLEQSHSPCFLVVEKVDTRFNLLQFVRGSSVITPEVRKIATQKLLEFAQAASVFQRIGDFDETQLWWDGHDWVLLDFTANTTRNKSSHDATIFSNLADMPQEYRRWLINATYDMREKRKSAPSCSRIHGR